MAFQPWTPFCNKRLPIVTLRAAPTPEFDEFAGNGVSDFSQWPRRQVIEYSTICRLRNRGGQNRQTEPDANRTH